MVKFRPKNVVRSTAKSSQASSQPVSQARLSQKTGSGNAFGGYEKVKSNKGSFYMKKTK